MAARSLAAISITFGLVSIPVKLYSATQPSGGVTFNLLHRTCGSRLRQQYLCIKEDVVVPREEIAKGYEFSKDQYVMFSPEELKALDEVATHEVEVMQFVRADAIDPVYYDRAYYLAPDKGGAKSYALFAEALRRAERTALGRWASRGKQYIVQLRPVAQGLVMQQLLYAAEVRRMDELEVPRGDVKDAELKLALQLVEQSTTETFNPDAFPDDVKLRVEAAVRRKVEGKEVTLAEPAPEADGKVIDLMAALKASLAKRQAAVQAKDAAPGSASPKRDEPEAPARQGLDRKPAKRIIPRQTAEKPRRAGRK